MAFFYGSETEQFFKIVRCLTPAQVKQSGRLFEVADIGNLVSSLVGILWSYKSDKDTNQPLRYVIITKPISLNQS